MGRGDEACGHYNVDTSIYVCAEKGADHGSE